MEAKVKVYEKHLGPEKERKKLAYVSSTRTLKFIYRQSSTEARYSPGSENKPGKLELFPCRVLIHHSTEDVVLPQYRTCQILNSAYHYSIPPSQ